MERRDDYNFEQMGQLRRPDERGHRGDVEHLHELEELREQLKILNDKLDKQNIFNQKVLVESINKSVKKLNSSGKFYIFFGVFAILYCPYSFDMWGFSSEFVWGTALMLAVCLGYTIYLHRGIHSIDIANENLVELNHKVVRLRKGYGNWLYVGFMLLAVWCYFLYREAEVVFDNPKGFLYAALVGGVFGAIIGLMRHFKVVRDADRLLKYIKDIQQE